MGGASACLACLAGLYSERAGIVDIGLEGKLLAGAFAAASMSAVTGSAWLGLLAGIGAAMMFSGIHGLASINFKGNQTISGVALNFLAAGLTTFLGQSWFKRGGYTPQLSGDQRFSPISLPFADQLKDVPVIGQIYWELISGHNIITYFAFLAVPVTAFVLFRTRFGLRLRAVGENPKAIDTAGISVTRLRYQALAALIFAKWRPGPALLVCLMFGFLDAVQFRVQGQVFPIIGEVPVQAIQALPYVLTVVLLAGFIGRAVAPKAAGVPYTKER